MRDGKDVSVSVKRDARGKVQRVEAPWGSEEYQYGDKGEIERVTVRNGSSVAGTEYANGRLKTVTQFDHGRIDFDYYGEGKSEGRLKSLQTPAISLKYRYGADGSLSAVDCGNICSITYERDAHGAIASIALRPAAMKGPSDTRNNEPFGLPVRWPGIQLADVP